MPVATATQTQTSPSSTRRGGKRGGHRGRDGHRGGVGKSRGRKDAVASNEPLPNIQPTQSEALSAPDTTEDAVVCHICAEPVKYYSVPKCDHRTCHVCALRLRALYKKQDCTFCKVCDDSIGRSRIYAFDTGGFF